MFCKEYLIDLNATQACIRAGYSEKTANRIASENLSKLVIQEEISRLKLETDYKIRNAMIDFFSKVDTLAPKVDLRYYQLQ